MNVDPPDFVLSLPSSVKPSELAWTHTKPTNGGLYLLRECPQTTPTMHHLYRQQDGVIQILDSESHYTGDNVKDLHDSYEWFGPIPWE